MSLINDDSIFEKRNALHITAKQHCSNGGGWGGPTVATKMLFSCVDTRNVS
jgi:hypothetical protein